MFTETQKHFTSKKVKGKKRLPGMQMSRKIPKNNLYWEEKVVDLKRYSEVSQLELLDKGINSCYISIFYKFKNKREN